ncbi:hypothetical protein C5S35_13845, partial [Candidatus Methanophagaceae archaeon]
DKGDYSGMKWNKRKTKSNVFSQGFC